MKTYRLINNIVGWLVFAVAAFTYCSTIEPTASFWDCPEFITTGAKLEVGHPPGAPFFMLLANLFSQFASDPSEIAKMVNTMSAMLSAGCILFLFWSITHLAKRLICDLEREETPSAVQTLAIMASGICGALIYTWSDTFWFSAVEGEVYAFSSFLTALVFWLILKWENKADKPYSDRWLILIAYLVGLSVGVHLLNLLCIPAMVLVFYYKKTKEPTIKGSFIALAISVVIVAAVLYGVVPGIVKVAGWFELLFVNDLGCPFNTGVYVYLILLVASLVWAIWETSSAQNRTLMNISFLVSVAMLGMPFYGWGWGAVLVGLIILAVVAWIIFVNKKVSARILNTTVLSMTLMVIGYASYAIIVIRSTANPPMDQNSPEDVFTLGEYLSREQYGDRPLFFGKTYASQPEIVEGANGLEYHTTQGAPVYQRRDKASADEKDEYRKTRNKFEYVYPFNQNMLFPRIYDEGHAPSYKSWIGNPHEKIVSYTIPGRGTDTVKLPTQADNMKYFFTYQLNFMYWRYFLWNFAGRQNDIQGNGELEHGNWITGFSFIDNVRLGDQSLMPSDLQNNKGHNVFYCLPLLLGILGLCWQTCCRRSKGVQQFWVVFFLFFMTGIAIVIYLNQTPQQPRERDYAYAGSFYAYAMWCGLGISAIYSWLTDLLGRKMQGKAPMLISVVVSLIIALIVPLQMVGQTWDDHDRSGRFVCRDFGLNYLETIPHDGIIFTNGDNDTFPLWYNEDTEGKRTDVRVCNLSYLQTDWYIDQMKRPAYDGEGQSSPCPISWSRLQYTTGTNEAVAINPPSPFGGTMKEFVQAAYDTEPEEAKAIWGEDPFELKTAIHKFVLKEDIPARYKDIVDRLPICLPSDTLHITVDKEAVKKSGMMVRDSIPDQMVIDLKVPGKDKIYKSFMMMLEMLAESNFSRPIYMSTTVGPSNYDNLYKHFIQEGIAWRFSPFTFAENGRQSTVADSDKMYDNMVNKYKYGNLSQKGLYIDETTMRMCYTHRRWFVVLINTLVAEGRKDKALKALEKCEAEIPAYNVPYAYENGALEMAEAYCDCGKPDKAAVILEALTKRSKEYIAWYMSLDSYRFDAASRDCYTDLFIIDSVSKLYKQMGKSYAAKAAALDKYLDMMYPLFASKAPKDLFQ